MAYAASPHSVWHMVRQSCVGPMVGFNHCRTPALGHLFGMFHFRYLRGAIAFSLPIVA